MLGGNKADSPSLRQFSSVSSHHTGDLSRTQQFQFAPPFAS